MTTKEKYQRLRKLAEKEGMTIREFIFKNPKLKLLEWEKRKWDREVLRLAAMKIEEERKLLLNPYGKGRRRSAKRDL